MKKLIFLFILLSSFGCKEQLQVQSPQLIENSTQQSITPKVQTLFTNNGNMYRLNNLRGVISVMEQDSALRWMWHVYLIWDTPNCRPNLVGVWEREFDAIAVRDYILQGLVSGDEVIDLRDRKK